jgi:hypothetical protein
MSRHPPQDDRSTYQNIVTLKPHCIKFSPVLVPAGTSRSTSRRHHFRPVIQAVTRVMTYVANAVTLWHVWCIILWCWLQQCGPAALRALTWSTLNWLNRIQCGFKLKQYATIFGLGYAKHGYILLDGCWFSRAVSVVNTLPACYCYAPFIVHFLVIRKNLSGTL